MFIKVIPQGHCIVVERFGKPVRVAHSGVRFFIPILDKAKNVAVAWGDDTNKDGIFIELSEQLIDTKVREYITKDNVALKTNCVFRWRLVDPIKAIYDVDNFRRSLIEAVLNEIRSVIGSRELNEVLSARAQLSDEIVANIAGTCKRWGVNITSAEIQELKVADEGAAAAMSIQMEATRKAEAFKVEAKAKADALILVAEAEKAAMALRAEGELTYIETLEKVISKEDAAKILLAQKTLAAYGEIAKEPANKVFMPPPSGASAVVEAITVS